MIFRMLRPRIKAVQREREVCLVQMSDRMIVPWCPAVAEFEYGLSLIVSGQSRKRGNRSG
jgi:hypothetical protein